MQGSFWSFLSGLFARLLAALCGVTSEPPPIKFDLPAQDAFAKGAGACAQGVFGLSQGEGARDVVCIGPQGLVSAMATDGSADPRASTTRLLFQRFEQLPAVADVDRDGNLDLVALSDIEADPLSGVSKCQLVVLLGDGAGGFIPGYSSILPHRGVALASGDFDEDGEQDFAVPYAGIHSPAAPGATLFLSRPGGQFEITQYRDESGSASAASDSFDQASIESEALALDANGDAHTDIVFVAVTPSGRPSDSRRNGALHVLLGDGHGGFRAAAARKLGMWGTWFSLTAADYDEDGHTDVGVAVDRQVTGAGPIELPRILFGSGDGGFREPIAVPGTEASSDLHSVDYDGDGHVDLITSSIDGPVHVYAGQGDGSFAAPVGFALSVEPQWITTLDLDLDGGLDLVALTANGLEWFPLPPRQARPGAPRVYSFILQSPLVAGAIPPVLSDFDGDSDLDLVLGTYYGALVLLNEGDAGFRPLDVELFARQHAGLFIAGDVNGDGLVDMMHGGDPELLIHLQRADGTWQLLPPISRVSDAQLLVEVALLDANGDGRLDVVETARDDQSTSLVIHVQDADGAFSLLPATSVEGGVVKLADVNADGCFDMWVSVSDGLGVMIGDCAGKYAPEHFAATGEPASFEFVDMNIDGRTDFVFTDRILLANSSGGYDRVASLPGDYRYRLWVAELNGDGLPDVALTDNEILVLQGDGEGGTGSPQGVYSVRGWYTQALIGDLAGDELPDAIVVRLYGATTRDQNDPYYGPPGTLVELTVIENISAR